MKVVCSCIVLLAVISAGCTKKTQKTTCGGSEFDCLYQSILSPEGYSNDTTIPLEVHSYSFRVAAPHNIVKIGYQSLPGFSTTAYLMEIYDSTSATLLYSGQHTFSPVTTSYAAITPVAVVPGHLYTVRRIQTNWGPDIDHTEGRVALNKQGYAIPIIFPRTQGDLTVTGSAFYGAGSIFGGNSVGGPFYNFCLPYIDLVFN